MAVQCTGDTALWVKLVWDQRVRVRMEEVARCGQLQHL